MNIVHVPFTAEQVASLNGYQHAAWVHAFTCGGICTLRGGLSPELIATVDGWSCPECDYTQDWAHEFMADGSWRQGNTL